MQGENQTKQTILKKIKRVFTLLEVVVAIALVAMASGIVGLKMHKLIEAKRFRSEVERIVFRVSMLHKKSLASQKDCQGKLYENGSKGWVFEEIGDEISRYCSRPIQLGKMKIALGQRLVDQILFEFSASGNVKPQEALTFSFGTNIEKVDFRKIFQMECGEGKGPTPPL